jgi:hypothetical protein
LIKPHTGSEVAALVIIIKTIAADGLTATSWTRLQVAANLVKYATPHSTIVTLWELQIVNSTAIRHPLILLPVDNKMRGTCRWPLLAMPTRFFLVQGHIGWRLVKLATQG